MARKKKTSTPPRTENYSHPSADSLLRPEVGTQAQFRKKKPFVTYRYDSSLDPAMSWDEGNASREEGEALIRLIMDAGSLEEAKAAAAKLKAMSAPFLNWTGKAERSAFQEPTMPLFIHERLSTRAVIETLKGHRKGMEQMQLFADGQHSITDQVLKAYEHRDRWVNRMTLGDSLVVMNSLLHYEGMAGQVQMIYMDPPYGVKFGSNFQPFVRRRDVKHNDDEHMTYEPEMVQAYRDTWELGLHSWLTYMRDRLDVARELLRDSGSIFVQINDENVHHLKELMDEVFGKDNFVSLITFQTTSGFETATLTTLGDFLLWYAREKPKLKMRKIYQEQAPVLGEGNARWVLLKDGTYRGVTAEERRGEKPIPEGARLFKPDNIQSQGASKEPQPFEFEGIRYQPSNNSHWKAHYPEGMQRLADAGRIHVARGSIQYRRFHEDFPFQQIGSIWTDTITGSFTADKIYVVQTNLKVAERCILMTTDPGDLVLDPTCGSGTTAYMAERWGRRWITTDVSRVPMALARQRLLTATFPYYELRDEERGPAGGFVYKRKQNRKGEEVGGIVPHITLKSIANSEPPREEVQEPILNSPYEELRVHWRIVEGEPAERVSGRRRALYYYRPPGQASVEAGVGTAVELDLVNRIRSRVNAWREKGFPGVSRTTMELIQHWRRDGRQFRLFFAQLEAAETLIFLNEARQDLRQGIQVPLDEPTAQQKAQGAIAFIRDATKMATGTGKTTVMGMIATWCPNTSCLP